MRGFRSKAPPSLFCLCKFQTSHGIECIFGNDKPTKAATTGAQHTFVPSGTQHPSPPELCPASANSPFVLSVNSPPLPKCSSSDPKSLLAEPTVQERHPTRPHSGRCCIYVLVPAMGTLLGCQPRSRRPWRVSRSSIEPWNSG